MFCQTRNSSLAGSSLPPRSCLLPTACAAVCARDVHLLRMAEYKQELAAADILPSSLKAQTAGHLLFPCFSAAAGIPAH